MLRLLEVRAGWLFVRFTHTIVYTYVIVHVTWPCNRAFYARPPERRTTQLRQQRQGQQRWQHWQRRQQLQRQQWRRQQQSSGSSNNGRSSCSGSSGSGSTSLWAKHSDALLMVFGGSKAGACRWVQSIGFQQRWPCDGNACMHGPPQHTTQRRSAMHAHRSTAFRHACTCTPPRWFCE